MTTPIQTLITRGSRRAGIEGDLLRDYIRVETDAIHFTESDAQGNVNEVEVTIPAGVVIQEASHYLTNAELKTLDTDYVELVPAPGVGKYIQVMQVWARKDGADVPPEVTRIYRAAISTDDMLTEAEALAGESQTYTFLNVPDFTTPHYFFIGTSVTLADISGLNVPTTEDPADYFARVFDQTPVLLTVDGVPMKFWRTIDIQASRDDLIAQGYYSVNQAAQPTVAGINTYGQFQILLNLDSTLDLPLMRNETAYAASYGLSTLFTGPDGFVNATVAAGHDLPENTPLLVGVVIWDYRSQRDSRGWSEASYDAFIGPVDDVALGVLVRYQIHDVEMLPTP